MIGDIEKQVGGDTYSGETQLFLEASRIEWDKTGRIIACRYQAECEEQSLRSSQAPFCAAG